MCADRINQVAELGDAAAPLTAVPNLIGLCSEHGWWFSAEHERESCPEAGCLATVFFYRRACAHLPGGEDAR
jgi:hypothetical protein